MFSLIALLIPADAQELKLSQGLSAENAEAVKTETTAAVVTVAPDDQAACPSGYTAYPSPSLRTGSSPTGYLFEYEKNAEDCKCELMPESQFTCRAVVHGVYNESKGGKAVCRYYDGVGDEDRGDKYKNLKITFLCRNDNAPEPTQADCESFDGKQTDCENNAPECSWANNEDGGYCNQEKCQNSGQCQLGKQCSSQGWCIDSQGSGVDSPAILLAEDAEEGAEENSDEESTENLKEPDTAPEDAAVDGSWMKCADGFVTKEERRDWLCKCSSYKVRYGDAATNAWTEIGPPGKNIVCKQDHFEKDPQPGVAKTCECYVDKIDEKKEEQVTPCLRIHWMGFKAMTCATFKDKGKCGKKAAVCCPETCSS